MMVSFPDVAATSPPPVLPPGTAGTKSASLFAHNSKGLLAPPHLPHPGQAKVPRRRGKPQSRKAPAMPRDAKRTKKSPEEERPDVVDLTHDSDDEKEDKEKEDDDVESEDPDEVYDEISAAGDQEYGEMHKAFVKQTMELVLEEMPEDWNHSAAKKLRKKVDVAAEELLVDMYKVLADQFNAPDKNRDDQIRDVIDMQCNDHLEVYPTQLCCQCNGRGEICLKCNNDPEADCTDCSSSVRECFACRCKKCMGSKFECLGRCESD